MPPILYNNIASFSVNKKKLHVLGINFSPDLLNEAEYVLKNYVGAKKRVAQESRNFWLGGGEGGSPNLPYHKVAIIEESQD